LTASGLTASALTVTDQGHFVFLEAVGNPDLGGADGFEVAEPCATGFGVGLGLAR
jgi:hypothetical protein